MNEDTIQAYVITKHELEYVIEILEQLIAIADPSEYFEEEAGEAINILRSLNLEEINMNDEAMAVNETAVAYAAKLFSMLTPENEYQISKEVLEYINENPVKTEDQIAVTTALKELIDTALMDTQKEMPPQEESYDDEYEEELEDEDNTCYSAE